jgi:hypothetical protein
MALSPAARAALERFKSQQAGPDGSAIVMPDVEPANGSNGADNGSLAAKPVSMQPRPVAPSPAEILAAQTPTGGLFRPEQPKTFKESGISYRVLESLLLKTIKQEGPQTDVQLSNFLKLSMNVFREILHSMHKRELLDNSQPLHYDLTTKGRELVAIMEEEDTYVGPAPVSFHDYCAMVRQQAKRERRVSMEDINAVFSNYPMRQDLKNTLKEGFNSQRVMLFYGPPGNGKSLITDSLHRLLREPVVLPYAFEFSSKIVQVYDPAYHTLRNDLMQQEEEECGDNVSTSGKPDRRWLISDPPLVTVGTEFKVAHFEVAYDGQYFAPPHVKSNNGIFIFDDLGRQVEDHNTILNQFIYPLEQRESIVRFAGGSSLRVPFLQRLFLSTNLNHEEILDDAFKRRLLYQVLVDRPTTALWRDIFKNEAIRHGLPEDRSLELVDNVLRWYKEDGRVIRACDPRNLFVMVDAATDERQRVNEILDNEFMRRIYERYPAAFKKDAKFFVGSMDSTGEGDDE